MKKNEIELNEEELEVIEVLSDGFPSSQEIAQQLKIPVVTVTSRLQTAGKKLGPLLTGPRHTREEIVLKAWETDLIQREEPLPAVPILTERELEILKLVKINKSNAEIGQQLGVSVKTIKNHFSQTTENVPSPGIFQRLGGISSRKKAVESAETRGFDLG